MCFSANDIFTSTPEALLSPHHTHPWPLPGQSWWRLPLVEQGLGRCRKQGVLEERTPTQAGPPQLAKALTLEVTHSLRHSSFDRGHLKEEKCDS